MERQRIRKLLITVSLLLFPITLYYFSPALIVNGAFNGVINGSFIVFTLMLILSIPFGRVFCSYLCPGAGLQECVFAVNSKPPKQGRRNYIKYVIWSIWLIFVIICYINSDKTFTVDFFFETENGISVSSVQSYVIYYGIICLIFIPSVIFGKRTFCHYFCWMAPFMVLGTKIRQILHIPGLHIKVNNKNTCISCKKCNTSCPMCIDIANEVKKGAIHCTECIQCGACIDSCPKKILSYGMSYKNEGEN